MDEARPEVPKGTAVCPACRGNLIPILYGLPDAGAGEAAERGEIALGGCIVSGDDPQLRCISCQKEYWTRPPRQ